LGPPGLSLFDPSYDVSGVSCDHVELEIVFVAGSPPIMTLTFSQRRPSGRCLPEIGTGDDEAMTRTTQMQKHRNSFMVVERAVYS
jgi:hypothetical protein